MQRSLFFLDSNLAQTDHQKTTYHEGRTLACVDMDITDDEEEHSAKTQKQQQPQTSNSLGQGTMGNYSDSSSQVKQLSVDKHNAAVR